MSTPYPPEPWTLVGQMHVSTFLVPVGALAHVGPPAGWSLLRLAGRVPVGAAWVVYEPGGVLHYRELLVSVLVRRGRRVRPHVFAIWVDSPASRAGGRRLWGIPKGLAAFGDEPGAFSCTPDAATRPVARADVRRGLRLPRRWPLRFTLIQDGLDGATGPVAGPVASRAGLGAAALDWEFDPRGELGLLARRRPVLSCSLHDFAMLFGMTPTDRTRRADRDERARR